MNTLYTQLPLPNVLIALSCILCSVQAVPHERADRGKIHVLIVDGFSNHNWQQTTLLTKNILEASGLFAVEVSSAPPTQASSGWASWRPPFAQYDVVIQNCNSYGDGPTWPAEVQQDLEIFVAGGGGLYILHSGNNAFPQWEAYNRMIGLGWRNKEFGAAITVDSDGTIIRVPPGQGGNTGHGKRSDTVLTRLPLA